MDRTNMIVTIYKKRKKDIVPVANIELVNSRITVYASERYALELVQVALPFPTKRKTTIAGVVVKSEPRSDEENLTLTLRQNITHPYIFSNKKNDTVSKVKYERTYDASILNGGADRRVSVA